jgi:hypothetical protein
MTAKADFTEEEWELVREAPPSAGLVVISASRGGTFRETFAMSKAYVEARSHHGESELLDEIVSSRPKVDRGGAHSTEELKDRSLEHLRDAIALVERKATLQELADYRSFIMSLVVRVADAHREHGEAESPEEKQAIEAVRTAIGAPPG